MADQATLMAAEHLAKTWQSDDGTITCRCDGSTHESVEAFAEHLAKTGILNQESDLPEVVEASRIWAINLNPEWTDRGIWPHIG